MEKKTIYAKLLLAKKSIGKAHKGSTNPHFKNKYADINALIEAVESNLIENGLILLQPIEDNKVVTRIVDAESGESIESCISLPIGGNPQQLGSAITYYRRYTLQSLLSMQADDDDGNLASTPIIKPIATDDQFSEIVNDYLQGKKTAFKDASNTLEFTDAQKVEAKEIVNANK